VGVVIAALIGLMIYLLVARRNRRRATLAWVPTARGALDNAVVARDLLVAEPSTTDAAAHESVRTKVSEAAAMLDRVASDAPDDDARMASHDSAEALRGLLFAIEAERLLPGGRLPPTADQLAQADLNRRQREADLESAMARLRQHVTGAQARTTP
jgi:hypothetical protein